MPEAHEKIDHEFYTTARWNNWLGQVKESGFEFKEEESTDKEGAVFVNMTDDVILACLKVIAKYESDAFTALNTAFIQEGSLIHLKKNAVLNKPLHLLYYVTDSTQSVLAHPRNLIVAEQGASATII